MFALDDMSQSAYGLIWRDLDCEREREWERKKDEPDSFPHQPTGLNHSLGLSPSFRDPALCHETLPPMTLMQIFLFTCVPSLTGLRPSFSPKHIFAY